MTAERNPVAAWLESRDGESWSSNHYRHARAGESDLPNHIASVRPAPGEDPFWDRGDLSRRTSQGGVRDPRQDPAGAPPLSRQKAPARTGRTR